MMYELPTSVEIEGTAYEIRSDYRAALDICAALSDPSLSDGDRALVILDIFYPGFAEAPRLVDWEQDFPYIVAPVNRVCGQEIRAVSYMHWWTFVSYYYEIGGDCTFAQIVHIRDKLARGKTLDKSERVWYRQNRRLVDFKTTYTDAEEQLLKDWA